MSGGGVLQVNFTYDSTSNTLTGDTLVSEITAAFESGKTVLYVIPSGSLTDGVYQMVGYNLSATCVATSEGVTSFSRSAGGYPIFGGK